MLLKVVMGTFVSVVLVKTGRYIYDYIIQLNAVAKKYKSYNFLLQEWLQKKNQNISILQYCEKYNIRRIAIYGMGDLGQRLYEELSLSDFELYGIDQNKKQIYAIIDMYDMQDELPEADAVIITPYLNYNEIEHKLKKKGMRNIISLENIIYELH